MAQNSPDETGKQRRMLLLAVILFISYLCVAIALPVVPVFVAGTLHFGNVWAGLGVGVAFLSTIVSRGWAGSYSDRRGGKAAAIRGLQFYVIGAVICIAAGLASGLPVTAYLLLLAGRLVIGLGESLTAVGIIAWGIGIVGPARSGKVLSMVGAALYGALAVGGPIGLLFLHISGFAAAMVAGLVLPLVGIAALSPLAATPVHSGSERPSLRLVMGKIWQHGLIICLQGIGFAAIGAFFVLYFRSRDWNYAGFGMTAFGCGFVLVRLLFGHLPDRIGGVKVALVSLVIETIGQLLVWQAGDPYLALVGAFLTGLGCSMIFPAMGREVVGLVEPHLRGTALGGFSAFQDLSYGLTGPLAGLLADRTGYDGIFLAGAISAAIGVAMAARLASRKHHQMAT